MHPKLWVAPTLKAGLTFTIKTLGKYTVGLPDAAEELSLAVNRRRTRPQVRQAKSSSWHDVFRYDFTCRSCYSTT